MGFYIVLCFLRSLVFLLLWSLSCSLALPVSSLYLFPLVFMRMMLIVELGNQGKGRKK